MNIEEIKKEYNETLNQLSDPELISDWDKGEELLKKKNFFEKIIEKDKELEELNKRVEENRDILKSQEDQELCSLAEAESSQLKEKERIIQEELKSLLSEAEEKKSSSSPFDADQTGKEYFKASIIEIRAGTGGEEAALFAADLFKMYSKYAILQNWKQKILDSRTSEMGGLKEITFELTFDRSSGRESDIFSKMRYEAGVHRVQRIPTTEKSGRIHTSTASVAVLPKPKKGKITLNPNDLKVDTYKASGPGGQYVNKRETAIRITHLPTGTVVASQTARNLQQNRENALSILEAKILEKKEMEENTKLGDARRSQIGKAQRAEKIRTYNFPQDRVTDHRIKKSFHNIEGIMEGKLDPIIKNLSKSN